MNDETQTIYINLDDSGGLNNNEKFCIYGGVIFFSKDEKDKFITQYRDIVAKTKCKYCKSDPLKCDNNCPELKNYNLHSKHKRRLVNYIKTYQTLACIIINDNIQKSSIKEDVATRRRYTDYAIKRAIKNMIKELIRINKIDPNKPLKIVLNMDQQSTKSNGYYGLAEGIKEELIYGISNFDYGFTHKPILFSTLEIRLQYLSSATSYVVQASDLVAGTIRRTMLYNQTNLANAFKEIEFITYQTILP